MSVSKGYATISEPDQKLVEIDTITCFHCQRVIFVKPRTAATVYLLPLGVGRWQEEAGAFCRVCMRPICLPCCDLGVCLPWEKQMERSEAKDRLKRSVR